MLDSSARAEAKLQEAEAALERARQEVEALKNAAISVDNVTITACRDGIRITVDDQGSDSLAIIEVRRNYGTLVAKVGLRGNFDVAKRQMRYMTASMVAPDVSSETRSRRKTDALLRRHQRTWI